MNNTPGTADSARTLKSLFPDAVSCVFSAEFAEPAQRYPEEELLTTGMVEKRYREFHHGRACARKALLQLGQAAGPIGRGKTREPLWPEGFTGSISHTGHYAAAVAASTDVLAGLGLDIEMAEPLDAHLIDDVCLPAELTAISNPDDIGQHAKILFCIKESIYKCLWPMVREFIDFTEMEVRTEPESGRYRAIPRTDKCDAQLGLRLAGRFARHGELILASAWIE